MSMKTHALLFALLLAAPPLFADGFIVVKDPPQRIPGHPPFAPLAVAWHHVDVQIRGQIAVTSVDQAFVNESQARLEGDYIFPVPSGAQIEKFTMEINGKETPAELLPAEKARKIYEDIVRSMRDPALLEYAGKDMFRMRIFPIEPGETKKIRLKYTQALKPSNGLTGYLYPLNTEKFSSKPIRKISITTSLHTKAPITTIYSPSHAVKVERKGEQEATILFEAENTTPHTDFQLYYAVDQKEVSSQVLTYKEPGEDGYFLLALTPRFAETKPLPKDVVFVLDHSGSMAGRKLQQATQALQFCVANLNPEDRFEIISFSTEAESLFGGLRPADMTHQDQAAAYLTKLKATGGTAIEDALKDAIGTGPQDKARPFLVIFLTDGLPTIGEQSEDKLLSIAQQTNRSHRIFTFGIGHDVNTKLLDRLAEGSQALSQYVLPDEDLELKLSGFFTSLASPVLTQVKVSFPDALGVRHMTPHRIPDLYAGNQILVTGRFKQGGSGKIEVSGMREGKQVQFSTEADFSLESGEHAAFVPKLWATRRVGWLLEEMRDGSEKEELKTEIIELARRYGIVTPYTAFLIVEDEASRGTAFRSLAPASEDSLLRSSGEKALKSFKTETSGQMAVSSAIAQNHLKNADYASEAMAGGLEAFHAGVAAMPATAPARQAAQIVSRAASTARTLHGRTFYNQNGRWVDHNAQHAATDSAQRIQFGSDEYFALLSKYPEHTAWFSLGKHILLVLDEQLYEIFE
jgi:Ca-activated chloride channel family protein